MKHTVHSIPQRRSLVAQTAEVLREEIAAGTWKVALPGERELSARLHVSRPTLRAALELLRREGTLEVSQGQRRRIQPKAAKQVRHPSTRNVVLLTPLPPHQMPPFVMFWVDELRQHLMDDSFHLDIVVRPIASARRPEKQLEQLVQEFPSAVWVLFLSSEPMQRWFASRGIACVVTGSCFPEVHLPSVDIDTHAVCHHAAGLFAAKKHRHLALLLPEGRTAGDQASEIGFLEASTHSGVKATVVRHSGSVEGVCRKVENLITGDSAVTALLVARSAHALTAFTYLQKRGVRIPEDLAFISRDNDSFLEFVVPQIARYSCEPVAFARRVSRLVLQLMREGPVSTRQILLMPQLIRGDTL